MYFNEDNYDNNTVFNGDKWLTYQQAVNAVTEKDEYSLLYCLLEAANEQLTAELSVAIKSLIVKMFP